jgi:hypothetical protein
MDVASYTTEYKQILAGAGPHDIVCRGIIRPAAADLVLAPGVALMQYAADPSLCTVWDGATNTVACGVLVQPVTAVTAATPCTLLASGAVKNSGVNIYSDGVDDPMPTLVQWNQMQTQCGIVPVGTEYGS